MALTKAFLGTGAEVDACAEVAQNAVREGALIDLTGSYDAAVAVQWAVNYTTAHTGTRLLFQARHAAAGDEDWVTLHEPIVGVGTANSEVITDNPAAAAAAQFHVADTTGYVADGVLWVFLEDVSTFANSEWLQLVSHSIEAGDDHLNVLDGSKREHAANSIFYNVAGVVSFTFPFWAGYARVIVDNTYDSDGSTVATRTVASKVTAVQ